MGLLQTKNENSASGYKIPLSEEAKVALAKEEEENEVGFNPLQAAALSAGASLLRNSGWRNTPMSLGEGIGHAIPAGMQAYYNQDAMNQNEQQALYERQQAEQKALDAKQAVEDEADLEKDRATDFQQLIEQGNFKSGMRNLLIQRYKNNPDKAFAVLEKILIEKKTEGKDQHKILTPEEAKDARLKDWETRTYQQNLATKEIKEFTYSDIKEEGEKIDYEGVSQNMFAVLEAAKNPDGSSVITGVKLASMMKLPPEDRYEGLKGLINSVDTMGYKKFVSEGGLEVRKASLTQTQGEWTENKTRYETREKVRVRIEAQEQG